MVSHKKQINNDKEIIVTGAAGFIGSGVVRHLNDMGNDNLVLFDVFDNSVKWKNLVKKKFLDVFSKDVIFDYLKDKKNDVSAIIHLGACSDTTCNDSSYLLENNYRFTQKLCEIALNNNIKFIYASSAATYGDGKKGFCDDHNMLEDFAPLNMYAYSKHLFDLWALKENILDKIVGLKYFNVFGPNEYHKDYMASMVYKMTNHANEGNTIKLFKSTADKYKDGEQCRDFIYVKDVVKMTCGFLENYNCGIFNIGLGKPTTWNFLAESLFNALGRAKNIEYVDMPKKLISQYQNYTCADMRKYYKINNLDINNPIVTPVNEAVDDYVKNYILRNERW